VAEQEISICAGASFRSRPASSLGEDQATAATAGGRGVFHLEGIGEDVAQFITACNRLLSAIIRHTKFSELEKK